MTSTTTLPPMIEEDLFGSPLARTAFDACSQGMLVLDPAGRVVAVNAAFCALYRVDPGHVVGKPHGTFSDFVEVIRQGDAVARDGWVTMRALSGERVGGVVQLIRDRRDGRELYARCGAVPHHQDGRFVATVITVEDVTEATIAAQRLDAALSAAEVGVWWVDLANPRVWGDANFARLYGLTEAEAQGGPLARAYELMHPDDRERATEALRAAAVSGEPHEIVFRVVGSEGRSRWLLSRGRSELDLDGRPIRRTGSVVDVTRQKEAEEALRRVAGTFESLVRKSPFGLYVVDADFRMAVVSQGAQKILENVHPLIGRDFAEVQRIVWGEPFATETIAIFRHTLDTGEPYHAPSMVERRHDVDAVEAYDWKVERIVMHDGRFGLVCHFYDQSERQRTEAELESRVEERTGELMRANRDLDEFAYSVAHDLRSPLRTIVLTSRLLLESAEERLTGEEQDLLARQSAGAVRLANIVDDLLKFARLANAEFGRAPVDLTKVAKRAASEASGRGWTSPPTIEIQEGMRSEGDANLLGYALTNLLDNACKFSPEGGTVTVGHESGAFFVRDQGVGFDMAYAGKLFVAFERLVDQKTFQGTGLGLANVKRIVERHGGRVWAESEPGKGRHVLVHSGLAILRERVGNRESGTFPTFPRPSPRSVTMG